MKERPIIFSAPMVRAILDGRKTQTRRLVSDRNSQGNCKASWLYLEDAFVDPGPSPAGNPGPYLKAEVLGQRDRTERLYPRVFPGDRLWVRETWAVKRFEPCMDHEREWQSLAGPTIRYLADGVERKTQGDRHTGTGIYHGPVEVAKPSIHMPRWASRITLEITGVRVERLQAISDADCEAEGVLPASEGDAADWREDESGWRRTYRQLWEKINGPGSWVANPWVWVIEFKRMVP